jgi:hypothetical protein
LTENENDEKKTIAESMNCRNSKKTKMATIKETVTVSIITIATVIVIIIIIIVAEPIRTVKSQ